MLNLIELQNMSGETFMKIFEYISYGNDSYMDEIPEDCTDQFDVVCEQYLYMNDYTNQMLIIMKNKLTGDLWACECPYDICEGYVMDCASRPFRVEPVEETVTKYKVKEI